LAAQHRRSIPKVTGYWEFQANPRTYDILSAVRQLDVDQWITTGKPVEAGHSVIFLKAKGDDSVSGVVAFGEVVSNPEELDAGDGARFWTDSSDAAQIQPRVKVRYVPLLRPLWIQDRRYAELTCLNVGKQGTVFYSDREKFELVARLAGITDDYMIRNRLYVD
jgi:hypothetical protein